MADVLLVPALEIGHPVSFVVPVKADDSPGSPGAEAVVAAHAGVET
jgi:hypothetical protein